LKQWALVNGDGPVVDARDNVLSITSKLLRFRWNGAHTVGVGSDADGAVRINAVLDAVAWYLATATEADDTLHLILGVPSRRGVGDSALKEQLGAIGTIVDRLTDGPNLRVWVLDEEGPPTAIETTPAAFTTLTPKRWNTMLVRESQRAVVGLAAELGRQVTHPAFNLYPKLSSMDELEPWQMRLDGLTIGRVGSATATFALDSRDLSARGEPRAAWRTVVGDLPRTFTSASLPELVTLIERLVAAWTDPAFPGAVLGHGQAEHALEAHLLSGRLKLTSATGGLLGLAVPVEDRAIRAAQFPTLWGDVTRPARYLDALLADEYRRPWAIELKDQDAGGGHGKYLRHGIGQAVLYRHFIRTAGSLDPFFNYHHLARTECQAGLAFPTPTAGADQTIQRHRDLAGRFGVEVIAFPRPGDPS